ncbi:hypothetical protein WA556_000939 [Blastocystis sp. ATCC 50177/Nand II]
MSSFPRDRISIAPMLGITNDYQRYFVRLMTKRATLYTEMFVDETVLHHPACDRLVHFDKSEHPIIAQLGGSNKYKLLEAARILEKAGYDEINLNCGCPSPRVSKGCFGARMMLSPWRVYDIVQYLQRNLSIPVTVKCRLGVDDHDSYDELVRFIHIVSGDAARAGETPLGSASDDEVIDEPARGSSPVASTITSSASSVIPASCAAQQDAIQLGCRHFIIHARKCLLEGLSVKENRSVPPLRYDWVFRLLDDFPALDFSLNGGVVNLGVAQELLDRRSAGGRQLRGVMIGRMLSKAPWLLHYVDQFFYGERNPPCDRYEAIMKYIDFCEEMQRGEFAPAFSPNEYLKPLFNVFVNTPGGGAYRREIFLGVNNGKSLREAVEHGLKFVSSDLLHDKAEGDIARIYEYEVPKD